MTSVYPCVEQLLHKLTIKKPHLVLRIMHTLACQWGEVIFKHWLWSNNRCWDKTGAFSETGRRRIFKLNTKEALLMLSQKQLCRKKQVQMKTEWFFSGDLFQKTKKQTNLFLLFFCSFFSINIKSSRCLLLSFYCSNIYMTSCAFIYRKMQKVTGK